MPSARMKNPSPQIARPAPTLASCSLVLINRCMHSVLHNPCQRSSPVTKVATDPQTTQAHQPMVVPEPRSLIDPLIEVGEAGLSSGLTQQGTELCVTAFRVKPLLARHQLNRVPHVMSLVAERLVGVVVDVLVDHGPVQIHVNGLSIQIVAVQQGPVVAVHIAAEHSLQLRLHPEILGQLLGAHSVASPSRVWRPSDLRLMATNLPPTSTPSTHSGSSMSRQ